MIGLIKEERKARRQLAVRYDEERQTYEDRIRHLEIIQEESRCAGGGGGRARASAQHC
jgi:hypothetical protein